MAEEKKLMEEKKFQTDSGIPVKKVYTESDLVAKNFDPTKNLGSPGEYPYTRGIDQEMFRRNLWIMVQYAGFGAAEESNERFKYLLNHGQTGLSIALDLPTQLGYDSDHPLAFGEVGKVGVAINSLQDMEILFDGISLRTPRDTFTTANAIGPIMVALFIALGEKQGLVLNDYFIRIQNDPLKEFMARGTYIFSPKNSIRLATDAISYCAKYVPHWSPICVCGYHIREAGSTCVQELAITLANAIAYMQTLVDKGVDIDTFAQNMKMLLDSQMDFFEEIAKYRAARRIWARMLRERFKAKDPRSMMLKLTGFTSGSTLTYQQPINNVVRATLEALGFILGGGQSLAVSCMDEALGIPTEDAVRTALRTQQIIAYETGIPNTVDPLGGSYYIESLTSTIEEKVLSYLKMIEEKGGVVKAIEEGFVQREIANSSYKCQKAMESGEKVIVGVNRFQIKEDRPPIGIFRTDPEAEKRQVERLVKLRRERDNRKVQRALKKIYDTAQTNENLVPPILEAVKAYATIGEICSVQREVFGEYQQPKSLT
jgi:methylmalonyl-CoA mutase N-terminal domain/subunit